MEIFIYFFLSAIYLVIHNALKKDSGKKGNEAQFDEVLYLQLMWQFRYLSAVLYHGRVLLPFQNVN